MLNWIEKQVKNGKWAGNLKSRSISDLMHELEEIGCSGVRIPPTGGKAGHRYYNFTDNGKTYQIKVYRGRVVFYVDKAQTVGDRIERLLEETQEIRKKISADRELLDQAHGLEAVIRLRIEDEEAAIEKIKTEIEELKEVF